MKAQGTKLQRKFQGIVVSDRMEKTIVVRVDRVKTHPIYHQRFIRSKKYKVHDEKNDVHVGDVVEFIETRPRSKDKRWRVLRKIKKTSNV